MITITDSAAHKIQDLLAEENNPQLMLRTFVQGGGCSGFSYGFTFDEQQNEDDMVMTHLGIRVLIDSMSMMYLEGSVIDYTETLTGSQFSITNPNATTTCGCGSSFSV
jgi:iron-sulfur cluster insertion protein